MTSQVDRIERDGDAGEPRFGLPSYPSGDKASQATCRVTGVPAGNYAIAFFHAQQNETQLTPGLFGKPTQGYGFSNNAAGSFGPPNFTAAAFAYDGHPAPSPTGAVFMLAVMSARRWRGTTATSAPAG
jgi:hypothetical protein